MRANRLRKIIAVFPAFLLLPSSVFAQGAKAHWTYTGADGPADWGKLDPAFSSCSAGHRQSPIDMKGAKKADLPALRARAKSMRRHMLVMARGPGQGYIGQGLGIADMLAALYFHELRWDPERLDDPESG